MRRRAVGLFIDRTVNFLANEAFQFGVPATIYLLTGSATWAAVVFGLEWVCRLAFLLVGGVFVDQWGPRLSARLSLSARGVLGMLGWVGLTGWLSQPASAPVFIAFCGILSAGLFDLSFVANERLATELVDDGASVDMVQSRLGAVDQTALIVGPALAAGLLVAGAPALFLSYAAVMTVGAIVHIWVLREADGRHARRAHWANGGAASWRRSLTRQPSAGLGRHREVRQPRPHLVRQLVSSVREVSTQPVLMTIVLTAMSVNVVLALVLSTLPAFVAETQSVDARFAAVVMSLGGAISLLAILLTPVLTRRIGRARSLWIMTPVAAVVGMAASAAPPIGVLVALLLLVYGADAVVATVVRAIRMNVIPRERYAQLMSAVVFLNFLPMPITGFFIGALADRLGLGWTWAIVTTVALLLVGIARRSAARTDFSRIVDA